MTDDEIYHRPAEAQLPNKLREMRESLLDGFESRAALLRWLQKLCIRTLGQVPTQRYEDLAEGFRPDRRAGEGVIVAAFLDANTRSREIDETVAERVRQQWAADVITPTQTHSFRSLRKDAGEYVGDSDDDSSQKDDGYQLEDQTFVMRPALAELDQFQAHALDRALAGLEDHQAILDWGDDLVRATRGESIRPDADQSFVRELHNDPCGDRLLCGSEPKWQRAREWLLCRYVLPSYNRAVQDLTDRTAEEPVEPTADEREERLI